MMIAILFQCLFAPILAATLASSMQWKFEVPDGEKFLADPSKRPGFHGFLMPPRTSVSYVCFQEQLGSKSSFFVHKADDDSESVLVTVMSGLAGVPVVITTRVEVFKWTERLCGAIQKAIGETLKSLRPAQATLTGAPKDWRPEVPMSWAPMVGSPQGGVDRSKSVADADSTDAVINPISASKSKSKHVNGRNKKKQSQGRGKQRLSSSDEEAITSPSTPGANSSPAGPSISGTANSPVDVADPIFDVRNTFAPSSSSAAFSSGKPSWITTEGCSRFLEEGLSFTLNAYLSGVPSEYKAHTLCLQAVPIFDAIDLSVGAESERRKVVVRNTMYPPVGLVNAETRTLLDLHVRTADFPGIETSPYVKIDVSLNSLMELFTAAGTIYGGLINLSPNQLRRAGIEMTECTSRSHCMAVLHGTRTKILNVGDDEVDAGEEGETEAGQTELSIKLPYANQRLPVVDQRMPVSADEGGLLVSGADSRTPSTAPSVLPVSLRMSADVTASAVSSSSSRLRKKSSSKRGAGSGGLVQSAETSLTGKLPSLSDRSSSLSDKSSSADDGSSAASEAGHTGGTSPGDDEASLGDSLPRRECASSAALCLAGDFSAGTTSCNLVSSSKDLVETDEHVIRFGDLAFFGNLIRDIAYDISDWDHKRVSLAVLTPGSYKVYIFPVSFGRTALGLFDPHNFDLAALQSEVTLKNGHLQDTVHGMRQICDAVDRFSRLKPELVLAGKVVTTSRDDLKRALKNDVEHVMGVLLAMNHLFWSGGPQQKHHGRPVLRLHNAMRLDLCLNKLPKVLDVLDSLWRGLPHVHDTRTAFKVQDVTQALNAAHTYAIAALMAMGHTRNGHIKPNPLQLHASYISYRNVDNRMDVPEKWGYQAELTPDIFRLPAVAWTVIQRSSFNHIEELAAFFEVKRTKKEDRDLLGMYLIFATTSQVSSGAVDGMFQLSSLMPGDVGYEYFRPVGPTHAEHLSAFRSTRDKLIDTFMVDEIARVASNAPLVIDGRHPENFVKSMLLGSEHIYVTTLCWDRASLYLPMIALAGAPAALTGSRHVLGSVAKFLGEAFRTRSGIRGSSSYGGIVSAYPSDNASLGDDIDGLEWLKATEPASDLNDDLDEEVTIFSSLWSGFSSAFMATASRWKSLLFGVQAEDVFYVPSGTDVLFVDEGMAVLYSSSTRRTEVIARILAVLALHGEPIGLRLSKALIQSLYAALTWSIPFKPTEWFVDAFVSMYFPHKNALTPEQVKRALIELQEDLFGVPVTQVADIIQVSGQGGCASRDPVAHKLLTSAMSHGFTVQQLSEVLIGNTRVAPRRFNTRVQGKEQPPSPQALYIRKKYQLFSRSDPSLSDVTIPTWFKNRQALWIDRKHMRILVDTAASSKAVYEDLKFYLNEKAL